MAQPVILVLDPHKDLADMVGEVLSSRGYPVAVAESFEAAQDIIKRTATIRVAVCHATMTLEGSTTSVPVLDELARHPDIALVVISSRPFEDIPGIPERAVCLAKPFGAGELLGAISRASQGVEARSDT